VEEEEPEFGSEGAPWPIASAGEASVPSTWSEGAEEVSKPRLADTLGLGGGRAGVGGRSIGSDLKRAWPGERRSVATVVFFLEFIFTGEVARGTGVVEVRSLALGREGTVGTGWFGRMGSREGDPSRVPRR
jgi:hypothetical protein